MKFLIILAVCVSVAAAAHLREQQMTGGTGEERSARDNKEIEMLLGMVEPNLMNFFDKPNAKLIPISYKTQVVAGLNYFIKAKLVEPSGEETYVHLAIYKNLSGQVQLTAYKMDVPEDAELTYFQ